MPKICYRSRNFSPASKKLIDHCNTVIAQYMAAGYRLTLRQLYYRLVAAAIIPNKPQSYKNLGSVVNDARIAGLIDWDAIEDRTRNLHKLAEWGSPQEIISACAEQFRIDKWQDQKHRVEVWIEKEALAGVFTTVCDELQVPLFACRGYNSQSEQWVAAMRLDHWLKNDQTPVILHFGDHDPSGIDMTRDNRERINDLFGIEVKVVRVALNMDQVEQYEPPPNPAKVTDSRFVVYQETYGDDSWELDALDPPILIGLVRTHVLAYRNETAWKRRVAEEKANREQLGKIAEQWEDVVDRLEEDT